MPEVDEFGELTDPSQRTPGQDAEVYDLSDEVISADAVSSVMRMRAGQATLTFIQTFTSLYPVGAAFDEAVANLYIATVWKSVWSSTEQLWNYFNASCTGANTFARVPLPKVGPTAPPTIAALDLAGSIAWEWTRVNHVVDAIRSTVQAVPPPVGVKAPKVSFGALPPLGAPLGVAYVAPKVATNAIVVSIANNFIRFKPDAVVTRKRIVALNWAKVKDARGFFDADAVREFTQSLDPTPFPESYQLVCEALGTGYWSDICIFSDTPREVSLRSFERSVANLKAALLFLYGSSLVLVAELSGVERMIKGMFNMFASAARATGCSEMDARTLAAAGLFQRYNFVWGQYFIDYSEQLNSDWSNNLELFVTTDAVSGLRYTAYCATPAVCAPTLSSFIAYLPPFDTRAAAAYCPRVSIDPPGSVVAPAPVFTSPASAYGVFPVAVATQQPSLATGGAGGTSASKSRKRAKAQSVTPGPLMAAAVGANVHAQRPMQSVVFPDGAPDVPERYFKLKGVGYKKATEGAPELAHILNSSGRERCFHTWFSSPGYVCTHAGCLGKRDHTPPLAPVSAARA